MIRSLLLVGLGGFLLACLFGLGALAVVEFGLYDTRATTPHAKLVAWGAHTAMENAVGRYARQVWTPPNYMSPTAIEAGFVQYDSHCVMCHGGPGVSRQPFVNGMTPSPPYVVDSARFWKPSELFVIVNNGVKMTAMPAWGNRIGQGEVWNLVAFLEALPYLSPRDYAALRAGTEPGKPPLPASNPAALPNG